MKIIVTHKNPDIDALSGIWLIKRFLDGWSEAEVKYVPMGETYDGRKADSDDDIIHLDTGGGRFDHHQSRKRTCAAKLILKHILEVQERKKVEKKALTRMINVVCEIDNGQDVVWSEPESDRYEFCFQNFFWNAPRADNFLDLAMQNLEMIFVTFKDKIHAEESIIKKGIVFESTWGKALAIQTRNDYVLFVGEKQGFVLVAKQDPKNGHLRIYSRFDEKVNLSRAYKKFMKMDPEATWYLHPSRHLLLNGSRTNPERVPTKLTLGEIIEVLKNSNGGGK